MLINDAHIDSKKKREINNLVGPPFGFLKALSLGGIGSQRLIVVETSQEISDLFKLDKLPDHCNIEIRPRGVIVHFRSRLETFAWILPFEQVAVATINGQWQIKDEQHHMVLSGANNKKLDDRFMTRVQTLKAQLKA